MRSVIAVIAALGALATPALSQTEGAVQPAPRKPTGKWVVEYADSMCVLQREYGTTDAPLTLGIKPSLMDKDVRLIVLQPASGGHKFGVPATVTFGTRDGPVQTSLDSLIMNSRRVRLSEAFIDRRSLNRAIASGRLELQAARVIEVRLALPGFGRALAALDECVTDLLKGWGIAPAEQQNLGSFPQPRGGRLRVSHTDYPIAALDQDASGATVGRIKVSVNGDASDCVVLATSKSKDLDTATCKVLLRARYEPAVSKAGPPAASYYIAQIVWRLAT